MPATEHSVPLQDGRQLRVLEDGDPAGVPLVSHHGTPGSRMLLPAAVRDAAERGIRLIGYDRPGYGGSTPQAGRRVVDAAADVAAIADALSFDRFLVVGGSGGGPHALACAARLPERVIAAASLASVAPDRSDGLDFLAGMGEDNVTEFNAALAGRDTLAPLLERFSAGMLRATPAHLVDELRTLIGAADEAILTGELAESLLEATRAGIAERRDGWLDDDLAFTRPWGFELGEIRVAVALWQGEQDRMVPPAHGAWLAERIPGVERHLTPEDGHLTLLTPPRVAEVHAWLVAQV